MYTCPMFLPFSEECWRASTVLWLSSAFTLSWMARMSSNPFPSNIILILESTKKNNNMGQDHEDMKEIAWQGCFILGLKLVEWTRQCVKVPWLDEETSGHSFTVFSILLSKLRLFLIQGVNHFIFLFHISEWWCLLGTWANWDQFLTTLETFYSLINDNRTLEVITTKAVLNISMISVIFCLFYYVFVSTFL